MTQLHLHPCSRPVCERPCFRDCPYERSEQRAKFRQQLRRGKVVGPVDEFTGMWMVQVEGFDPWKEAK